MDRVLPPHPIGVKGQAYIAAMNPQQKALHELAIKMLGSSYFVEQTRGFLAWK
jgi:hypothetical protein